MTHQKTPTERPMLFNAPMVRATLDDNKTQTRRVFKAKNGGVWPNERDLPGMRQILRNCPYGQPGDRLWVRETFVQGYPYDATTDRLLHCDAGGNDLPMKTWYRADKSDIGWSDDDGFQTTVPWKPSIHMPRTASRILLEIVSVRIERLQDMEGQAPYPGESDALAEGVNRIHHGDGDYYFSAFRNEPHPKNWSDPTDAFRELWESINGAGSWDLNPLVWVIEFKRVTA